MTDCMPAEDAGAAIFEAKPSPFARGFGWQFNWAGCLFSDLEDLWKRGSGAEVLSGQVVSAQRCLSVDGSPQGMHLSLWEHLLGSFFIGFLTHPTAWRLPKLASTCAQLHEQQEKRSAQGRCVLLELGRRDVKRLPETYMTQEIVALHGVGDFYCRQTEGSDDAGRCTMRRGTFSLFERMVSCRCVYV
ncbi:hypothetical protein CBR_g50129 [Chara braunii]|uniref:Uncharacterized protein n=1 Tax=Chara braunii TaxID=69332 RepID=A0A388M674_CHABU|nr:hypothetical protein CBR_g50129 [Chara braunii]|eukprot:GBG90036.1 hypothetical protein CBR_g50129 [Chara braunii]